MQFLANYLRTLLIYKLFLVLYFGVKYVLSGNICHKWGQSEWKGKIDGGTYLILLSPTALIRDATEIWHTVFSKVSEIANLYLHLLRLVGSRLDCIWFACSSLKDMSYMIWHRVVSFILLAHIYWYCCLLSILVLSDYACLCD